MYCWLVSSPISSVDLHQCADCVLWLLVPSTNISSAYNRSGCVRLGANMDIEQLTWAHYDNILGHTSNAENWNLS